MNTEQKIKKIIFCDTLTIIEESKNILFIALKPEIYAYLKQKGILVHNTLPYFKNESHEKALRKSKILMEWIRSNANFVDLGIGIKDAYREILIFWLRLAVHHCLWQIEIILNAIDAYQPEIVGVSFTTQRPISSLYVQPEEGYLAYFVAQITQTKAITYERSSASCVDDSISISNSIRDFKGLIKFVARYAKFRSFEIKMRLTMLFTGKKPIIFATRSYQMDKFAQRLRKECSGWPLDFLKLPLIANSKMFNFVIGIFGRKYWHSIETQQNIFENLADKIKKETELFSYQGISFSELISNKIKNDFKAFILGQTFWSFMLKEHLDKIKPAMMVSNAARNDDMLLAELCQKNKIKNILVSHGSHVYPKNEYEQIEWREHGKQFLSAPVSHIAMPTPVSEGYLKRFPSNASIIKTGPLIWGTPVNKKSSKLLFKKLVNENFSFEKTNVILHAGTPKPSNSLRLFVYETPDEYIQALCDLAQAVEKISDTILVIKFRPLPEITINTLKSIVPFSDKVVLCIDKSFLNVLGMADLLVSFSSTSIDEALQNRIPVLLYGGGGRYQHIPAYEIKPDQPVEPSAIYYAKENEYLNEAIIKILNLDIATNYSGLFDKYIYPTESRSSLAELLEQASD